jgi:glutathione S-transferase
MAEEVEVLADLIVHQIPSGWGLPSVGPFSLKLETYLKIVEIPYEVVFDATPFKGPKGKLPWIEHEGSRIGDSGFIIEYLEQHFGCNPNAGLSAAERAIALALRRLIEEDLYWTLVYDRWMAEDNWAISRNVILGRIPTPFRQLIAPVARRGVRRQLEGQGIGRHSREEIHAIGIKDVGAIADFLGDKPFLMGGTATEIDAVAYGILANIMLVPIASPIKDEAMRRTNLVDFLARIRDQYFA